MDQSSLTQKPNQPKKQEKPKLEKVVQGGVAVKKPGRFKQFLRLLVNDDVTDIREYLFYELFIPTIKDTLNNAIQRSSEMFFYGKTKGKSRSNGSTWTSYGSSFDERRRPSRPDPRSISTSNEIEFDNFDDARRVVDELNEQISRYHKAYLGDLFDVMGITGNGAVDWERGWTRYITDDISYYRGKWILRLPRCEEIE